MTLTELTTLNNLNDAFYECTKISKWKESTQKYEQSLLINNLKLQNDLLSNRYKIGECTYFKINERGKTRFIEAPNIRDRIVQKLLCKHILVPKLSKYLIYDNYASLKNRGTSFARKRLNIMLNNFIKEYRNDGYILKIDIEKFFENIDHIVLKKMISKYIKEPKEIMNLIYKVINESSDTYKGLNLGSECPQIFAIFYLSGLDNYLKTIKRVKYYGRYMDDIFIISYDKNELKELLKDIENKLLEVKLKINKRKTSITKLSHGFTFMQIKYNIVNNKIIKRPTHSKIVRERKRLKKYKKMYNKKLLSLKDIYNNYISWRNALIKDCNKCFTSISCMNKLFKQLFNIQNILKQKHTREYYARQTLCC